jgi:hypothetical protein
MKRFLLMLTLLLPIAYSAKGETQTQQLSTNTETQSAPGTIWASQEQLQELLHKAKAAGRKIVDSGKPRSVQRRAKPELIIRRGVIAFNGKRLKLGSSIAEWEKTLGKSSRLTEGGSSINTWDELGIITYRLPGRSDVVEADIFLNRAPRHPILDQREHVGPDGKTYSLGPDFRPTQMFPGYLELDGAGIDAQTKVWEVNALAKRKRKFTCSMNLHSCHAATEDEQYTLDFATDNMKDEGTIYRLSISD